MAATSDGGRRIPAGAAVLQQDVSSAIRRATLKELALTGYRGMSMEAVAKRAGVGKAALYRRWPSKQAMVAAIVTEWGAEAADMIDSGSLAGDLEIFLQRTLGLFRDPLMSRILPDLIAEGQRDRTLARVLRSTFQRRRREAGQMILERAILRNELPPNTDIELALDLMAAPLFWRVIATKGAISPAYIGRLAEAVLLALQARG